jgi:SH3-like domain-containing protein
MMGRSQALRRFFRLAGLGLLWFSSSSGAVQALDYRSIGSERAILYDAPSAQAKRLFVVGKYYPVEIIVNVDQWAKVRDSVGDLAWVEKKHLRDVRMVVVTVARADVRQAADLNAPLVFQAERDVALELVEHGLTGWLKVRHRDGQIGFISAGQVWGAS